MKIKGMLLAALSLLGISGVFAQGVEYDDMYFNAEDRAKLNAQRASNVAYNSTEEYKSMDLGSAEELNPTDSYSARNVNPEYTSRSHSQMAQADNEDYFVNNYNYKSHQLDTWNNDYMNWHNSSWYRPNFYGPGINTWNSPYYGYSSFNSPWYDPYWSRNGWSSSFSFHYGNTWNYGWGGNYNYWNRPYYGWDPYYGNSMYGSYYGGMGMYPGYWNNYRYPGTIIVINDGEAGGRGVAYGKRPSRGTSIVSDRNSTRSRSTVTNSVREDDRNTSGRTITTRKQEDYYNRYNSNQRRTTTQSPSDSRSNTEYNRSRSWNNDNSSFDRSGSMNRTSSPSYSSPSRSTIGSGTRTNTSSGSSGRRGRD